jgi:hypothetical protein
MILPINLMLSPPPNQLLIFECHETKNCEIKPAVRVIKIWDCRSLSCTISARLWYKYERHHPTWGTLDCCGNENVFCGAGSTCLEGLMLVSSVQHCCSCWPCYRIPLYLLPQFPSQSAVTSWIIPFAICTGLRLREWVPGPAHHNTQISKGVSLMSKYVQ